MLRLTDLAVGLASFRSGSVSFLRINNAHRSSRLLANTLVKCLFKSKNPVYFILMFIDDDAASHFRADD
jgi:hypothetical protein